jgi:hypothetical protein
VDGGWPRAADRENEQILMYEPQLESWDGDLVRAYAAVSEIKKDAKTAKYGVVRFMAHTEVDKVNRQVTLEDFQITKVEFPTMREREAEYRDFLQAKLPGKSRIIALDRMEAALQATHAAKSGIEGLAVNNDPPQIIFATKPAVLVLIDGPPKLEAIESTRLQQVLNTKSTIILDTEKPKYYLNVMDGWVESSELTGPWSYTAEIPKQMPEIIKGIKERQLADTPEGEVPASPKKASEEEKVPAVFVSVAPTELLVTDGPPQFESITQAKLEYIKNTSANILRDPSTSEYFILLAGRWFQAKTLESGPWKFVPGKDLPSGFAKIPENSPKAGVLASIPGTGPAEEALIANSIPQTATITRSEAHLEVKYDGKPQFKEIRDTKLQYAVNTPTPVIRVDEKNYYAVKNAVWFSAASPLGPWVVADSLPDVIHSIPPSAPLHYVTYVKVYRSTPDVVYVGYTPGYYGSVVSSSSNTVVYGTGWYYPPYIGSYWYGFAYTYGVGMATTWSLGSGWGLTVGVGYSYPYSYPWWGPWGYYGSCCWGPAWGYGWGGYASANVYGRWGNTAYANTRAAWANPYPGNYGAGNRIAFQNAHRGTGGAAGRGSNTNIYSGNTFARRGAAAYNPATGIVAGSSAVFTGNIYSGQQTAGRGSFAYNTNNGAGVAAGANNIYAGKDGTVYRYDRQHSNWSQNSGNGWQSTSKSRSNLQSQQQARSLGQQRSQNFGRSIGGGMRAGGGRRR